MYDVDVEVQGTVADCKYQDNCKGKGDNPLSLYLSQLSLASIGNISLVSDLLLAKSVENYTITTR